MPDRTDLFGLNFWSGHSDVVTARKESLRIPVQLYSGLILLCEIEFTRKIKNCKQTWKYLNAWRPLKEAIHAILCLLGVFTRYFSFCGIKDLSWLERHRDKSTSLLRRELAQPFLNLTRFTAQIWSSQHYFTIKSADLIEAWKEGWGEKIIRIWRWFTRYFLFLRELCDEWHMRLYICRFSEAVRKCSLLFLLFIMLWVILFFNQKKKKKAWTN